MEQSLRVQISEADADDERIATLAGYLRAELLQLDVEDVTAIGAGAPPPGARASELSVVGGLLVIIGQTADSLRSVVLAVRDWLGRGEGAGRVIMLELGGNKVIVTDPSTADQERLIEFFISQHSAGGSDQCPASVKR